MKIKINETITVKVLIAFLSTAYSNGSWVSIKALIVALKELE